MTKLVSSIVPSGDYKRKTIYFKRESMDQFNFLEDICKTYGVKASDYICYLLEQEMVREGRKEADVDPMQSMLENIMSELQKLNAPQSAVQPVAEQAVTQEEVRPKPKINPMLAGFANIHGTK